MNAFARLLVPAALLASLSGMAWANEGLAELNTIVDQTNVLVNDGCSGTLLDKQEALVLTANHCVDQQYKTITRESVGSDGTVTEREVRVAMPGNIKQLFYDEDGVQVRAVEYRMEIVGRDASTDLAIVRAETTIPTAMVATVACKGPQRGEDVYIVGNPYALLYSSIVKGNVSGLNRTYEMVGLTDLAHNNSRNGLTQIAGGVVGGNSGGSVYNMDNELVGVPVLAVTIHENSAFAVPHEDIVDFLKKKLTSVPNKRAYARIMGHCEEKPPESKAPLNGAGE
jgi:S1-C subfamily serine protease